MLKTLLCLLIVVLTQSAWAAVEVNRADASALRTIKGIGPSVSAKIMHERDKGAFRDWDDLVERVPGVGPSRAIGLSHEGLTVNGVGYTPSSASLSAPRSKKHRR
jgi:competence protein ComEA